MVAETRVTNKHKGRANDNRQSFVEVLVMTITDPGLLVNDNDKGTKPMNKTKSPSMCAKIIFWDFLKRLVIAYSKRRQRRRKIYWKGDTLMVGLMLHLERDLYKRC